jgi:hypothetical protein
MVTINGTAAGDKLVNNIYILNSSLEATGEITGIASADSFDISFTNERAFLMYSAKDNTSCTLYVADLSDETQPSLLGSTKLDGYNGYIYPIDNTHILTMGKVVLPSENNETVFKDVKISEYDISNITEPVEITSATIGDRGTDSAVFTDKRSFFYDNELNIAAFPLDLCVTEKATETTTQTPTEAATEAAAKADNSDKDNQNNNATQGKLGYIGEYFYSVNDNTLDYKCRVSHITDTKLGNDSDAYAEKAINRVVRKGSYLYAVSNTAITAVDTDNTENTSTLVFSDN